MTPRLPVSGNLGRFVGKGDLVEYDGVVHVVFSGMYERSVHSSVSFLCNTFDSRSILAEDIEPTEGPLTCVLCIGAL